jgi:hypothetical protein
MNDALSFMKTYNFKSNDDNHLSTFDELETEHDNNSDEAALYFTKLAVILLSFFLFRLICNALVCFHFFLKLDEKDMSQRLPKTGYTADGLNLILKNRSSWSQEAEQRNVPLEDRLAHDNELDVTGIMNLSSMNVTDHDLPMIIQRAFGEGRKKCTGLILRDNSVTSEGVKMIVNAVLATRTNLKYLSFSNNSDIGDAGIEHLVRLLQQNRSLVFLAIPHTGMTDRGVRLLADVFCGVDADSSSPPLEKLYISFNKLITDESLEAIIQILEQNQTLKVLSVEHCSLSDTARKRLRQVGSKKKKKFSLSE